MTDQERIIQLESEVASLTLLYRQLLMHQALKQPRKPINWRMMASRAFIVLGLLVLIPAGVVLWLQRTVIKPDRYLETVGPVIHQPAVQQAIQKTATDQLFAHVDVNQLVTQALPQQAQFLAGPIASQVKTYTNNAIATIVASPQFASVWLQVNQQAQAAFIHIAKNSSGSPDIDISRVYGVISQQLQSTPLAILANRPLPAGIGDIQVATVPALQHIPHYVEVLETWRWLLLGLVAGCLGLGVGLSHQRRRTMTQLGIGVIITGILTLALVRIGRSTMLDPITDPTYHAAAVAIWHTILHSLILQVILTAIIGAVISAVSWWLGPGRAAAGLRNQSQRLLARGRLALFPAFDDTAAAQFIVHHRRSGRWVLALVTALVLTLNVPLTFASMAVIFGAALITLVIWEFLVAPRHQASPSSPISLPTTT